MTRPCQFTNRGTHKITSGVYSRKQLRLSSSMGTVYVYTLYIRYRVSWRKFGWIFVQNQLPFYKDLLYRWIDSYIIYSACTYMYWLYCSKVVVIVKSCIRMTHAVIVYIIVYIWTQFNKNISRTMKTTKLVTQKLSFL